MDRSTAVLITGCSSGIGRASALELVSAGYPVWATARNPSQLEDLAEAGCRVLELDVTDEESRRHAVKTIEAEHGAVGALVNNAGYAQAGPVEEVPLDQVRRQFETNVFGPVRLCQLVLPGMRAQRFGTIVNVGSAGGLMSMPASSAYDMTKWSLETLSDALRWEVHGFGIRVSLLEPGGVATSFTGVQTGGWPATGGPYDRLRESHRELVSRFSREGAPGILTPHQVARVVAKAVTARRPRTRYRIGMTSRILPRLYRLLPDRAWDWFTGRMFSMD